MIVSEADRARGVLSNALVIFRWAALAWMAALAFAQRDGFRFPSLAWVGIGAAGSWTAWMTVSRRERTIGSLWFELGLAFALVVLSGVVVPRGTIGARTFYATAWPVSAVAAWGVARGTLAGMLSALAIGLGLLLSRSVNGSSLVVQSLANGTMTYLLAGGAVGLVSRLLERSAAQFQVINEESMRAREREARAAERESMARAIHDSVLQSLAMVHKKGRELSALGSVSGVEVGALAEMAGAQEAELRALILREPEAPPTGQASLRVLLEEVARASATRATVSAVGPIWMGAHAANELAAAARQALDNVAEHAEATRVTVFAEPDGDEVVVSVRDDGHGFTFDPERLRTDGKAGMLKSMKGRVEALGGRMIVESAPGAGTEIEFRVPLA